MQVKFSGQLVLAHIVGSGHQWQQKYLQSHRLTASASSYNISSAKVASINIH